MRAFDSLLCALSFGLSLGMRHGQSLSGARRFSVRATAAPSIAPPVAAAPARVAVTEIARHWLAVARASESLALSGWFGLGSAAGDAAAGDAAAADDDDRAARLALLVGGLALDEQPSGELRSSAAASTIAAQLTAAIEAADMRAAADALMRAARRSACAREHLAAACEGIATAALSAQGLGELVAALGLPSRASLRLLECHDISHLQGRATAAGHSALVDGSLKLGAYGCLQIEQAAASDDPAAMFEALTHRLRASTAATRPTLLLIDGGKPQLSAARRALAAAGLTEAGPPSGVHLVALAKQEELLYTPLPPGSRGATAPSSDVVELRLPLDGPALSVLRRLRDEAHSTALLSHRVLRNSVALESVIGELGVPVGVQRRLREAFGSADRLVAADAAALARAAGGADHLSNEAAEALAAALARYRPRATARLSESPLLDGFESAGAAAAAASGARRSGRAVASWAAEARAARWWAQRRALRLGELEADGTLALGRLARLLCALGNGGARRSSVGAVGGGAADVGGLRGDALHALVEREFEMLRAESAERASRVAADARAIAAELAAERPTQASAASGGGGRGGLPRGPVTSRAMRLVAPYAPSGDQPATIASLVRQIRSGAPRVALRGATGTGKTFVMASVIEAVQKPALVLAPNKVLAAQLCAELRGFFPHNEVCYFASNFDYYRPESFNAIADAYSEKASRVNDAVDSLRHAATCALFERRDVIVVATVSCIYGLGVPEAYLERALFVSRGQRWRSPAQLIGALGELGYARADDAPPPSAAAAGPQLGRGEFALVGASSAAAAARTLALRVAPVFEGGSARKTLELTLERRADGAAAAAGGGASSGCWELVALRSTSAAAGSVPPASEPLDEAVLYPTSHHLVTSAADTARVVRAISSELVSRVAELMGGGRRLEAERLAMRVSSDLRALASGARISGIENYSRHLDGTRAAGEPPATLLSYLPADDWLLLVDESHLTVPQLGAMHAGDARRKASLIEHGFRLPSAADNRPLTGDEFWARVPQAIFVSATPGAAELAMCGAACEPLAELLIRPTGVVDPRVLVVPSARFEDHLLAQIARRQARSERALVTTLTKRSAEDLAAFLTAHGVRAVHLHADVAGAARLAAIEGLRAGEHDVLVGCNLLREGLDLPSVSLVAVVDADKMGFLRSATSLIQTIGRAARHVDGEAILYSHEGRCSRAMAEAIAETTRRRNAQLEHNAREGVSPRPLRAEGAAQQPADRERLLLLELLNGGKPAAAVRSDARPPPGGDLQGAALARYDAIRGWRDARARATRTRPFKILTEATMLALAEADPRSAAALRAVKGIGPVKAEQYGDALLDLFGSHATAAAAAERAAASLSEDPDAPIEEPAQPDAAKARVSPRPRRRTLAAAEVAGSVPAA